MARVEKPGARPLSLELRFAPSGGSSIGPSLPPGPAEAERRTRASPKSGKRPVNRASGRSDKRDRAPLHRLEGGDGMKARIVRVALALAAVAMLAAALGAGKKW
jgi:hypothetical protein